MRESVGSQRLFFSLKLWLKDTFKMKYNILDGCLFIAVVFSVCLVTVV